MIASRNLFSTLGRHLKRMLAIARIESLHLIHDSTSIALILIIPAVQIVLFGYAVNLIAKTFRSRFPGDTAQQLMRFDGLLRRLATS